MPTTVTFDQIPAGELVPFAYFEVKPSPSPFSDSLKVLLIGNRMAGGAATNNVPYLLSGNEANRLFGAGSMLAAMYRKAKMNAPYVEYWGIGLAPELGATAAAASILVSGDMLSSGAINVWIGGQKINVPVAKGDLAATVAGRIKDKINKLPTMPVTAAIQSSHPARIDLTCKWLGASGNVIRVEYGTFGAYNQIANERLTIDIAGKLQGGVGQPQVSAALFAIKEMDFDVIVAGPQTNSGMLDNLDAHYNEVSGRWSPSLQLYGHAITAADDTVSNNVTLCASRNGPHVSMIPVTNTPSPPYEWAAAVGAIVGQHMGQPPECSRPLQSLPILGCEPSRNNADWYSHDEKSALLNAGVSAWDVMTDGSVRISRIVTMRKTNDWGDPDGSWRNIETLFQNMFYTRSLRAYLTGTYGRCALTDKPTGIDGFTSPTELREGVIHHYQQMQDLGLVEHAEVFANVLVVERDALDANRVNMKVPIDVVNQLNVLAVGVESNLQYDASLLAA